MSKNNNKKEIFNNFKLKSKKSSKQVKEDAIAYAKEMGDKMLEQKKKARENFMQALLKNAITMNMEREAWEDENEDEKREEEENG